MFKTLIKLDIYKINSFLKFTMYTGASQGEQGERPPPRKNSENLQKV